MEQRLADLDQAARDEWRITIYHAVQAIVDLMTGLEAANPWLDAPVLPLIADALVATLRQQGLASAEITKALAQGLVERASLCGGATNDAWEGSTFSVSGA